MSPSRVEEIAEREKEIAPNVLKFIY